MVEVKWTSQSLEDINNISEYIAKDSPRYAQIQVDDFFETAKILEIFPEAGRIIPEMNKPSLRELIVGFYRVIYKIKTPDRIDVLTIYHSRRFLSRRKLKE